MLRCARLARCGLGTSAGKRAGLLQQRAVAPRGSLQGLVLSWRRRRLAAFAVCTGSLCGGAALLISAPLPPATAAAGNRQLDITTSIAPAGRALWRRMAWLFWSFSLVIACMPMALLSSAFCEHFYYGMILRAIRYSRSAAMTKWAQWASVRLDLLPATLCVLLTQLQNSAPAHPFKQTLVELRAAGITAARVERVEEARGVPGEAPASLQLDDVRAGMWLIDVEEQPLASGSVAQLHAARCGPNIVAVKVRHPRVSEELVLDFEIIRSVAAALHTWVPAVRWLNAPATVSQFEAAMSGQCNLQEEAENLRRFNANFRRKAAWTAFPQVLFATPSVLIETFEVGELASKLVAQWRNQEKSPEIQAAINFIITRGEDCYLQMLLVDNFMHADLHPGNMLFREVGPKGKPQVVLLDAGMAAHLTDSERKNFIGLLQAMGDGDGGAVGEQILSFSVRQSCRQREAFTAEVSALCREQCRGYGTNLDVGRVVRGLLALMHRHGVNMDGNYGTLVANMLCLEGLTSALDPEFNVIDAAYPFLRAHQLIGDRTFQRVFAAAAGLMPLMFWDLTFQVTLHAGKHGAQLKRFQI